MPACCPIEVKQATSWQHQQQEQQLVCVCACVSVEKLGRNLRVECASAGPSLPECGSRQIESNQIMKTRCRVWGGEECAGVRAEVRKSSGKTNGKTESGQLPDKQAGRQAGDDLNLHLIGQSARE